jgi:hypothetical protein
MTGEPKVTRTWRSTGEFAPAEAGSSRIHYRSPETGEECYRAASWRSKGSARGFWPYGHGYSDYGLKRKIADQAEFGD